MSLAYAEDYLVEPLKRSALDVDHLSRQTLGNPALEREVLAIFRRQARQMLFQLEALTDPKNRLEIAHALNSSAKGIGAWRVAEAAERLERMARDGRPSGAAVAELAESVSEVLGRIEEHLLDA